ncbi:MAG: DUF4112 domain-containing protein [Hyphomicrobium sp.]
MRTTSAKSPFKPAIDPSLKRETTRVTERSPQEVEMSLARLDTLATVMDSAFRIPGTNVTMGVDALLGLVPVIGDAISAAISSYLIWEAKQLGASKFVLARMSGNVAIDTIIGAVPFAGDIFDVAYKSNTKNIALLKKHVDKHGLRNQGTIEVAYKEIKT